MLGKSWWNADTSPVPCGAMTVIKVSTLPSKGDGFFYYDGEGNNT